MKNLISHVTFAVALCIGSGIAVADDMVHLPSDNAPGTQGQNSTGRLSSVFPGTVTYVSKDLLPPVSQTPINLDMAVSATGYEVANDDFFDSRATYYKSARNEASVVKNLTVPLATVAKSELGNYQYLGIIPDGTTPEGPWSMVIRVFKRADGVVIALREFDYVTEKSAIVVVNEMVNAKVGAIPAIVKIRTSNSGKALSSIIWATPQKMFDLEVFDNAAENPVYNKDWLIKVAGGIQ